MLRRQLLERARRLAGDTERAAMVDRITIDRSASRIYTGEARFIFTGKTEITQSTWGAATLWSFAEMHLPSSAPTLNSGDAINIVSSPEPSLIGRRGYVTFAEPVTSLSGFQRITIRLAGSLSLGGGV